MKIKSTLTLIALLIAFTISCAHAQVLLKPVGGASMPLRLKSLTADVKIEGQFASTNLQLVFYNESSRSMEAEFVYGLPDMASATYFAYWAGEEKVVARIVEKEKAKDIYETIVYSWNRDPALIEMTGKNTFRAKVFPVFPDQDLKIEIHYVQVLPSDKSDAVYTLPFMESSNDIDELKLESMQIKLHIKRSSDIGQIANNYGLKIDKKPDSYELSLNATNYRPPKDLTVRMVRTPKPLIESMYSARSGGKDGFFALALTPDHSLTNAKVTIRGADTYKVSYPRTTKAGRVMVVTGRYRGAGSGVVTLVGNSPIGALKYDENVEFEQRSVSSNIASKLWAATQIEQLSVNESNKNLVIGLCKQFALPSKFASWLAVPKSEMEEYRARRKETEAWASVNSLARMIVDGKGSTPQARKIRNRLSSLTKTLNLWSPKELLESAISSVCDDSATELARAISEGNADSRVLQRLRNRATQAAKLIHGNPAEQLEYGACRIADDLGKELARNEFADKPDEKTSATLHNQLRRLKSVYGKKMDETANDRRHWEAYYTLWDLAQTLAFEKTSQSPDESRMAQIEQKMSRIEKIDPELSSEERIKSAINYIMWKEDPWLSGELWRLRDQLSEELAKSQPDEENLKQLKDRFVELNTRYKGGDYAKARLEGVETQAHLNSIWKEIHNAVKNNDQETLAKLEPAKQRLEKRIEELRARMGDPLISIDAPADAQRVVALMPDGEIKTLEYNIGASRWEARFDIPSYATEGEYVITIIVVLKDATRKQLTLRYNVDITPPAGTATAIIPTEVSQKLRLDITASEDTARVAALMPWGERVDMVSSTEPNKFYAVVSIPDEYKNTALVVSYVLTDKAHNRTTITVDARPQ